MGMDVTGKAPTSERGEYFRNNVWWWHPLWDYCCEVAPEIIDSQLARAGHFNDGSGLDADGASRLAAILRVKIAHGEVAEYAVRYRNGNPHAENYPFDGSNVAEFADFLADSGGFEIH